MVYGSVWLSTFRLCTSLFQHNYWLEHLDCSSFNLAIVLFAYQISAVSNTDPTKDSHGRQRVFFRGKEICNNFNSVGGCSRMTCSFTHICKKCKGVGHGFPSCKAKGSLQQHPQQPAEKDQQPKTKPEWLESHSFDSNRHRHIGIWTTISSG